MLVPFESLPTQARIWIYQSDRIMSSEQVVGIQKDVEKFLTRWVSHQVEIEAGFAIYHNLFLIIGANQFRSQLSGCSIDASVHEIKRIEHNNNVNLLNRMHLAYRNSVGIQIVHLSKFKNLLSTRELSENTIVFNNLVQTKEALSNEWEIPISQSWHRKYL